MMQQVRLTKTSVARDLPVGAGVLDPDPHRSLPGLFQLKRRRKSPPPNVNPLLLYHPLKPGAWEGSGF